MAMREQVRGRHGQAPLLERGEQLAVLREMLRDASDGVGGVAVLRGEAGAGKSLLLRAFMEAIPGDMAAAIGYCDGVATPRPFSPIHDLARSLGDGLATVLESSPTREAVRDHLLDRFERLPVVLAIEDIQWADDATVDLVRQLAPRIAQTSTLLVLTYRDEVQPAAPTARLLGQLATSTGARQIALPPLSRQAVAEMAAGTSVDPEDLYRLTSGNPFFAAEMVSADAGALPRTVTDLIRARITEIDDRARVAVEAAAVLGTRTEPWLLAAVAGESLPGIDDAIAAGLFVKESDGIAFRHELTRAVVLDDMPAIRAIGLHRTALAALLRGGVTDPARLAHHAEAAADGAAVLVHAPAAARQASDNGAFREAIAQLRRALRFATAADTLRADLLERLGDAQMVIANGVEADEAWTEALAIRRATGNDPRQVGDLIRRISRSAMWRADFPRAMAAAEEAVTLLEPLGESHELAMAHAGLSGQLMMEARNQEAISWGERALAMAERLNDSEARVTALNTIGCARVGLGFEDGMVQLEQSLRISRAEGLWFAAYRALFNSAASAAQIHRLELAQAYFDELEQFAAGTEVLSCNVNANRADVLLAMGRWEEAEACARRAHDVVDGSLDPLDSATAYSVLARIQARRGAPLATEYVERASELLSHTRDLYRTWFVACVRAEMAWLAGDLGPVTPQVGDLFAKAVAARDPWMTAEIGRWLQRAGALPYGLPTVAGPHALALRGDWKGAADAWRERGNPYETALALLDADDPAAVREARDILVRLGATAVVAKALKRLRDLGAPVPRGPRASTTAHAGGLTEREAEVAALLAKGHSNREISERLFLSEKTVGHHVSAVLGKLGARRRGEVGARLEPTGTTNAGT